MEGTILTVLRDSAAAAKNAAEQELPLPDALDAIVAEAYASVQRTPDLLPVLKEHGVVDAGGFGLAIIFDAFTAALLGRSGTMVDEMSFARGAHPKVEIEQVNDWEGSQYRYCNEFLVDSDTLDKDAALEFLSTMGDCELCVGEVPKFKVHVHSDHPDQVLKYFLDHGQISEVFIHNMQHPIRRAQREVGRRGTGRAQAFGLCGRGRRKRSGGDPEEPRRRCHRLRGPDHEPLHEGTCWMRPDR